MSCSLSIIRIYVGNRVVERLRSEGIKITEKVYEIVEKELEKYDLHCYTSKIEINNLLMPAIISKYSFKEIEEIEESVYQETLRKIKQENELKNFLKSGSFW